MKNYIHPKFDINNEYKVRLYMAHSITYILLRHVKEYSEANIQSHLNKISQINCGDPILNNIVKEGFDINHSNVISFINNLDD